MRENYRRCPVPQALVAALVVLLLSGCAPRELIGHATVVSAPDVGADLELPEYVSYYPGTDLADVTHVGITTTFPSDSDWLTVAGGGDDAVVIDMTDEGCSLVFRKGSSEDIDVEFTDDDAVNTVATLIAYLGKNPVETLPLSWLANDGTVTVDALVYVVINDAGERVVGVARAFGALDTFVYYELSCDPGVVTEAVFVDRVAPYVAVTLA